MTSLAGLSKIRIIVILGAITHIHPLIINEYLMPLLSYKNTVIKYPIKTGVRVKVFLALATS